MGTLTTCPLSSIGVEHCLPCKNTEQVRQQLANNVFAAADTWFAQRRLVLTLGVHAVCVCVLKQVSSKK